VPPPVYPDRRAHAEPRSARPSPEKGIGGLGWHFEWALVRSRGQVIERYDVLDWIVRVVLFVVGLAAGIWLGLHVWPH